MAFCPNPRLHPSNSIDYCTSSFKMKIAIFDLSNLSYLNATDYSDHFSNLLQFTAKMGLSTQMAITVTVH